MSEYSRQMIVRFVTSASMLISCVSLSFGQSGYEGRAEAESKAAQKMIRSNQEKKTDSPSVADSAEGRTESESADGAYPLSFTMKSLDGEDVSLAQYQGKPLLIVNTASKCGFTPQYKDLQKLHKKYADKGLNVIGFPCNQFRGQEPGDSAAIRDFCEKNYGVSFEMFAKVDVKGNQQCDLYKYLTQQESSPKSAGDVSWNFEKFLVNGEGEVVARYASRVKPTSNRVTKAIEKLLPADPATEAELE